MDKDRAKLRRYENDLYISGVGIVIMGIWTVVKLVMQILLVPEYIVDLNTIDPADRPFARIVLAVTVVILSVIILLIHFYIGLNAIRSAKGRPYKKGYYVLSMVLLVFMILSMFSYPEMMKNHDYIGITIASILVDLTIIYMFFIVLISTYKINKLKIVDLEES